MTSVLPPPLQPFEFLAWFAGVVSEAGVLCHSARFRADGSLGLRVEGPRGPVWAWWRPPPPGHPGACLASGIPGVLEAEGLPPGVCEDLARAIADAASRPGAVMVAFGPGPEVDVPLTPEGLGDLLRRQVRPGLTRWGPLVARSIETAGEGVLRVTFSSDAGARVVFEVRAWPADGGRESGLRVERVEDTRTGARRRSYEHAVEHLVGFALARALGRGARLVTRKPSTQYGPRDAGGASPALADPEAHPDAEPPDSLTRRLMDESLPFEVPPDLFFRYRNAGFVSNTLVLLSPGWISLVCHGNRECTSAIPRVRGAPTRSTVVPWPRDAEDPWGHRVTDFDDEAVLRGGRERLQDAVRQAASDGRAGPVLVAEMCDYHQIADAPEDALQDGPDASLRTRICLDVMYGTRDVLAALNNRWRSLLPPLVAGGVGSAQPQRCGVTLVGFGDPGLPATRELRSLLEGIGIPVRAVIFPYLEEADARGLRETSLFVASPWHMVQRGPGEVLEALGARVLKVPGPWGVQPTRRWLAAIREAVLHLAPEADGLPDPDPAILRALKEVRLKARGVRVGLVAPKGGLREVLSPEFFYGFSPLDFLMDLGFEAVVLTSAQRDLPDAIPTPEGEVRVVAPLDGESLTEALARLKCRLVYSEYEADPRVLRAGAMPFSVSDLEPGFAGALRTGRLLLRKAAASRFFREHGPRGPWE